MMDGVARALARLGVRDGDTVAIFMPMAIETVAALMACAKIGAVWVPIFSGFGADAVAARIADAGCEVVITANASLREGAPVPMKAVADRAVEIGAGVEHLLVWERLPEVPTPMTAGPGPARGPTRWTPPARPSTSMPLDAEHPLFIALHERHDRPSEGRRPRARRLPGEDRRGGRLPGRPASAASACTGSTDLGWIMGPWEIVGALALGATVVLTEGSPTHPDPDRLWEQVARHRVTTLGVSPTLVRALIAAGSGPVRATTCRRCGSSPPPASRGTPTPTCGCTARSATSALPIVNLSGGTEVGACFLSPHPVVPTKVDSLGGPALGMDVDIVDAGRPRRWPPARWGSWCAASRGPR